MNTVAGTFAARSVPISRGWSKRSPAAALGPWSAVMSASKVRATVFPASRGPCSNTGVRPAGPAASVGGTDGTAGEDAGRADARRDRRGRRTR